MSDTKADHIETAAAAVVEALGISDASVDPDTATPWADLDPLVQNKVRIALADQYDLWEKQWTADLPAADPPKLGFRPIR